MLSDANENWYIILYDLFSRLWYIATCGPFCKDATHIRLTVGTDNVQASESIKILGVTLDDSMNMKKVIANM